MRTGNRRGRLLSVSKVGITVGAVAALAIPFSPTAANAQPSNCYHITVDGEATCVPFTDIDENTTVFLGFQHDGSATGFTNFNEYKQYVLNEYQLNIELQDGKVVVVQPGRRSDVTEIAPRAALLQSAFAYFFDRGNFRGNAFAVLQPKAYADLRDLRYPGHRNWNDKISSLSTHEGPAILCENVNCDVTPSGYVIVVPADTNLQLPGFFDNTVSSVAVP